MKIYVNLLGTWELLNNPEDSIEGTDPEEFINDVRINKSFPQLLKVTYNRKNYLVNIANIMAVRND